MILSVGYRVNSRRGTQFRIWATNILRQHLLQGYTLHQKRLQEKGLKDLEGALELVQRAIETKELSGDEAKGLLRVITDYAETWLLLRQYDDEEIALPAGMRKASYLLTYADVRAAVAGLRRKLADGGEASSLFGQERGEMLEGIIGNLYQTFDGEELYPTVEEKAAHLLYFVIKDHPFTDGNKRIGVLLFLYFLNRNHSLASIVLPDTMLVALALLIAGSDPKQKEVMLRLILHFIAGGRTR
jgi:prophage maintenance system killer protein